MKINAGGKVYLTIRDAVWAPSGAGNDRQDHDRGREKDLREAVDFVPLIPVDGDNLGSHTEESARRREQRPKHPQLHEFDQRLVIEQGSYSSATVAPVQPQPSIAPKADQSELWVA